MKSIELLLEEYKIISDIADEVHKTDEIER